MKKNKGFTLVELLAVLVILSILVAFSTVAVGNIKKKQDEKNRENVISSILTGAKRYVAEHPEVIASVNQSTPVSIAVDTLITDKFVEFDEVKYSYFIIDGNGHQKTVSILICDSNTNKLVFKLPDLAVDRVAAGLSDTAEKTYNDCGCEKQDSTNLSYNLCIE